MRGKMEIEILWILACDYEFPNGHSNRNDGIYVGSSLLGEADVSFGMWVLTDPSPFFRLKKMVWLQTKSMHLGTLVGFKLLFSPPKF